MLKSIRGKNYRNLNQAVEFPIESLNVFIGPNGSGKSNLLELISFLPETMANGLHSTFKKRRSAVSVANVDKNFPQNLEITWEFPGHPDLTFGIDLTYSLNIEIDSRGSFSVVKEVLEEKSPRYPNEPRNLKHLDFEMGKGFATPWENNRPNGLQRVETTNEDLKSAQKLALEVLRSPGNYPVLEYVRDLLNGWRFYTANDMDIRAIKNEPIEIDPLQNHLSNDGKNLVMVLYNLFQANDHTFQDSFERVLRALYAGHRGFKFPLIDSRHFELRWGLNPHSKDLTFDQVSDGTIRMLSWISILMNPNPLSLICLDEPELGIHPAWLPILADLIREAAKKTQVIITTHAPSLLDEFSENVKQVVVCGLDDFGCSQFERLDKDELEEWHKQYRLGALFQSGHPLLGGWPK